MKKLAALCLATIFTLAINANEPTDHSLIDHTIEKQIERPLLYAPWRTSYDATVNELAKYQNDRTQESCPFCVQCAAGDDTTYFILHRGKYNFVMMNAYPYSRGHLLILPYAHIPDLEHHSKAGRQELIELANSCITILKKQYGFEAFNIGFNIGARAGASIPGHLHMQLIPREKKDGGFIELIGKTSVVSFSMQKVYSELAKAFASFFAMADAAN